MCDAQDNSSDHQTTEDASIKALLSWDESEEIDPVNVRVVRSS